MDGDGKQPKVEELDEPTIKLPLPVDLAPYGELFRSNYMSRKLRAVIELIEEIQETRSREKMIVFVRSIPHFRTLRY
jgi:hypothetical protein